MIVNKEDLKYALKQLEYESAKGTHAYHQCNCGRKGCRSVKCILCWQDDINSYLSKGGIQMTCEKCSKIFYSNKAIGNHAKEFHHYSYLTKKGLHIVVL